VIEGNHTGQITHSVTSGDAAYQGLSVAAVQVGIIDNDINNPPVLDLATPTYVALSQSNGLLLQGTLSDDGPGLTTGWEQVAGPPGGSAQFDNAAELNTGVTFSQSGDYLLRFTADDGEYQESAEVIAYVDSPFPGAYFGGEDIGLVSAAGSAAAAGGIYTVRGSGADIWEDFDEFYYFSSPFQGDGHLTIRLTSQSNTNPWAKAGVMIRDSSSSDATHAFLAVTPDNGLVLQSRLSTRGLSDTQPVLPSVTLPIWLRLARSGDVITASTSADGITFTTVGTLSPPMSGEDLMGFAITSHNDGVIGEAVFDNLSTSLGNQAPNISASPDADLTLGFPATLSATVEDDGVPTTPGKVNPTWQFLSGPGTLNFNTPDALTTGVEADTGGAYTVRLLADDGELISFRSLTLNAAPWTLPAMTSWQSHYFTGPDDPEAAPLADAGGTREPNFAHFALDAPPGSPAGVMSKVTAEPVQDQGQTVFQITIPVRRGAVFAGDPPAATVDGLTYRLTAKADLNGADLPLEEIPPVPDGLPPPGDYDGDSQPDYQYHSFRISTPLPANGRAFIGLEVLPEAP
jgi:hypothetical protein